MRNLDDAARDVVEDEVETGMLLRERAEELKQAGDHRQAAVYDRAAAKADNRAGVFRGLLKK
ncbi:hypothetical protein [Amycolatopsis pithecellobii]|uniref:Uncharacterized protein n=1 Tax=Amycolatopsis pithecellobii TaxID=664692 RepID=A0A6N7Z5A1_9PSEU|nr:hypothetical protein [Amycolatopsis pithecellobii]MTD55724.1 hypothetical protein [Amycolatopsis pithecellobii]